MPPKKKALEIFHARPEGEAPHPDDPLAAPKDDTPMTTSWEALAHTPETALTRHKEGGEAVTTVNPFNQILRITNVFGRFGEGWGYHERGFELSSQLVHVAIQAWYSNNAAIVDLPTVHALAPTTETRGSTVVADLDAPYKALLDALAKSFFFLGLDYDLNSGINMTRARIAALASGEDEALVYAAALDAAIQNQDRAAFMMNLKEELSRRFQNRRPPTMVPEKRAALLRLWGRPSTSCDDIPDDKFWTQALNWRWALDLDAKDSQQEELPVPRAMTPRNPPTPAAPVLGAFKTVEQARVAIKEWYKTALEVSPKMKERIQEHATQVFALNGVTHLDECKDPAVLSQVYLSLKDFESELA